MVHRFYFYDASITTSLEFSYVVVDVCLSDVLRDLDTVLYLVLEDRSSFVITRSVLNDEPVVNIVFGLSGEAYHKVVNICDNYFSLRGLEVVI